MDKRADVDARAEWRVQAFCRRQNLGLRRIHFGGAESNPGPHAITLHGLRGVSRVLTINLNDMAKELKIED